MPFARVSPKEAHALMEDEGYTYLDVRSIPEFERGHPQGAVNVPLLHFDASRGGMVPNADFLAVVAANFPKDAKLVLGCKSGGRSMRAAQALEQSGYLHLVDQRAGFDGGHDATGRVHEQGWLKEGLPVATEAPLEARYDAMRARVMGRTLPPVR